MADSEAPAQDEYGMRGKMSNLSPTMSHPSIAEIEQRLRCLKDEVAVWDDVFEVELAEDQARQGDALSRDREHVLLAEARVRSAEDVLKQAKRDLKVAHTKLLAMGTLHSRASCAEAGQKRKKRSDTDAEIHSGYVSLDEARQMVVAHNACCTGEGA